MEFPVESNRNVSLQYPRGPVPLDSPFYIERLPIETLVFEEIKKPGALVRIKAPKEMGKTSLLIRLLGSASEQGYRTVTLNLEQVDEEILGNLNRFLRWLCASVSRQLGLEPRLDDYWDEDIGSKVSCTLYFRSHLLDKLESPLVVALDEVNYLFEHPQVAKEVFPLLRSWYEEGKRLPSWQKFRMVVVHSTEIYVPLQLKQSPFNVGLPVELGGFTTAQVQDLAQRYGLAWTDEPAQRLMTLVGGHPALVQIALYHLRQGNITLEQLLETASTSTGIYAHHLQRLLVMLQEEAELVQAFNTILYATEPIVLDPIVSHKLGSMGLIHQQGDRAVVSCELYHQYFTFSEQSQFQDSQPSRSSTDPQPQHPKRRRGVVLTATGTEKLQEAKTEAEWAEHKGKRYTLEELSERTSLSVDTLMKVLACEVGVDKQTLKIFFRAFNLTLEKEDYDFPLS